MKKPTYTPDTCVCCGQTATYMLGLDRGSVVIVKKIARAIAKKGVNSVHLSKDSVLNHSELCNIVRPRNHGLIARVRGESGSYLLTTKGSRFLRGEMVPKYAIVSKVFKKQIGYFEPEAHLVSIHDLEVDPFWEGFNYEIEDGILIKQA